MHFREARSQASSARRRAGTFGIGRESWPARSACATDARYLPGMPATSRRPLDADRHRLFVWNLIFRTIVRTTVQKWATQS
jgi:hypothetical protein